MTVPGLVTHPSALSFDETVRKLEAGIAARRLTVFARIDHAAGAAEAGMSLRPTLLLIFGNAKAGTPLMQQAQTIGIDLPLKLLVWQDEAGTTQISWNQPAWIAARHGVGHAPVLDAMESLLRGLAEAI